MNSNPNPYRRLLLAQAYPLLAELQARGVPQGEEARVLALLQDMEALLREEALEALAQADAPEADNLLRVLGLED